MNIDEYDRDFYSRIKTIYTNMPLSRSFILGTKLKEFLDSGINVIFVIVKYIKDKVLELGYLNYSQRSFEINVSSIIRILDGYYSGRMATMSLDDYLYAAILPAVLKPRPLSSSMIIFMLQRWYIACLVINYLEVDKRLLRETDDWINSVQRISSSLENISEQDKLNNIILINAVLLELEQYMESSSITPFITTLFQKKRSYINPKLLITKSPNNDDNDLLRGGIFSSMRLSPQL